jgi:4-amino-4-deoxy-L-arabinose transferase-like glycosyltransferase
MSETPATEFSGHALGQSRARPWALSSTAILAAVAGAELLVHLAAIRHYGFFRDELYYLACGEHLAWGYVDQPPLIALLAWISQHLLGNTIVSLRLMPVLAGAAVLCLTGLLARELGGGKFAQFLAAVSLLCATAYLAFDSFFSMNAFEPLFWVLCAWIVVRILKGGRPQWWLAFGVVAGVGLENKHTMLVFGFAMVGGLLLAGEWKIFRSPWIWMAALVALVMFLPNLLWEARHGWPQFVVVHNARVYKNIPISPLRFLAEQVIFMHPFALPVWFGGLVWCFFARRGRPYRFLGWAYLIVLAIFIPLGGKSYYALPFYPMLMAAGGVAFEQFTESSARSWLRVAFPLLLLAGGALAAPFGVPLLPIEVFLRYAQALPMAGAVKTERDAVRVELPQLYADMFGWDTLATTVAEVYRSLPEGERADCGILGGNYGEAGAIDAFGPALGLPPALSGHNSYFYWGPRGYSGRCMIIFGERSEEFVKNFGEVHLAATRISPHSMPNEQSIPIYVCRKPVAPLELLWPRFKMII